MGAINGHVIMGLVVAAHLTPYPLQLADIYFGVTNWGFFIPPFFIGVGGERGGMQKMRVD